MTWYRNQMHRHITPAAEFAGHALRYAYARDRIDAYKQGGYSLTEALTLTSIDLGHGRWSRTICRDRVFKDGQQEARHQAGF